MVKIERSSPPPESHAIEAKKMNGRYNCSDVVERLKADFHNKCYICEISPVQDPEIEHLLPHKNGKYPDRKFDWDNLFWSCGHCNSLKNTQKYEEGILNCCVVDPEEKMSFSFSDGSAVISAKITGDVLTDRTVDLVNEVFNKKNTGMRIIKCQVRTDELQEEMNVFFKKLGEYQKNKQERTYKTLRGMLERKSRFAAFKRDYIRRHGDKYPELSKLII